MKNAKEPVIPISVEFRVHGDPQPQGSTRAFMPKGWTRPIITTDNKKLKPWRQEVAGVALEMMSRSGQVLTKGPVSVSITFSYDRPKTVRAAHKTTKPDIDKLLRAALDSMTGIVFKDDSQVVHTEIWKNFGVPGAMIRVTSVL